MRTRHLNLTVDADVLDADLPWAAVILLMLDQKILVSHRFNALEGVVWWFASPERLCYHVLSRAVRATLTPVLQIALGIVVKRAFGLNVESSAADDTQLPMLRRYINSVLLSQEALERAFRILGHHYQVVAVSVAYFACVKDTDLYSRLFFARWGPRSASGCTGQDQDFIALTLRCLTLETMLFLGHDQSSLLAMGLVLEKFASRMEVCRVSSHLVDFVD